MELILGLIAIAIYMGIIGVLLKDAMDQINRRHNEWKIIRRSDKRWTTKGHYRSKK